MMELVHKPLELKGALRVVTWDRINKVILLIAGLLVGYWVGNGHTTMDATRHIAFQLGNAEHTCQRNRWIAIDAGADPKRLPACPK